MLPIKAFLALAILVAGSATMANVDPIEVTSVSSYSEPKESGDVIAVVETDDILDPDAVTELFERKACRCRTASQNIDDTHFRQMSRTDQIGHRIRTILWLVRPSPPRQN